ncbi:2-dehydropantoate 2-reductase [Kineosphaera limosa]|uniref:2-dehydropantoate 2-reductase n=1 Tax=Kineosphaera limosa NBRC 100340 TaxID=1184609 RepID=K6WSV6_9MICO|nr:2-dehydropantoate 2-reductase [Kineosphaera limosa]NYE00271.1 2-dehydropantoate 2-reductase [Kineosphaera limosa]GAB96901.1 putative 2-dehydropantoate 2-reductase [Kineosphaera limosa NBRC 100340]
MRIGVMGAGAVGCYYGGMLARAGHDVTLVGRSAHVEAMREGLRVQTASLDELVPVQAATDAAALADCDLVLVAVKSGDSTTAARELAGQLRPEALVLSLQNGVDNADRLAAELPGQQVEPVVVYVATEMAGPGHVRHHGRGDLAVAPSAARVVPLFEEAGIPVAIGDVRAALWGKLVANCAWNALSAITDRPYGWLAEVDGVPQTLADIVAECRAVAAADGVEFAAEQLASVASLATSMPAQRSSTAQDLARRRPTEIDHLNGYVVRRGADLGVPTPVNALLVTLVRALERKGTEA